MWMWCGCGACGAVWAWCGCSAGVDVGVGGSGCFLHVFTTGAGCSHDVYFKIRPPVIIENIEVRRTSWFHCQYHSPHLFTVVCKTYVHDTCKGSSFNDCKDCATYGKQAKVRPGHHRPVVRPGHYRPMGTIVLW